MTFEWPTLLIGLALVPILMALYARAQRRRRAYAVRFTNLALLSSVMGKGPGARRHVPPMLFLVGLAALLLSLARPVAVLALPREQSTVLLVIDVSASMTANDMQPNRMIAAQQAARTFVEKLPGHVSVGLVSFNSRSAVNAGVTRDHRQVLRAIDGLRAAGGTAIGDGLAQALDQLAFQPPDEQGARPPALVVLLSDGESQQGIPVEEAASRAADEGVQVNTVGIGQRGLRTPLGGNQTAGLDEEALQGIAQLTGGQYFYAAETNELEQIYGNLSTQVSWVEERQEVTALAAGLGVLALIVAGLLSLRWFQQLP